VSTTNAPGFNFNLSGGPSAGGAPAYVPPAQRRPFMGPQKPPDQAAPGDTGVDNAGTPTPPTQKPGTATGVGAPSLINPSTVGQPQAPPAPPAPVPLPPDRQPGPAQQAGNAMGTGVVPPPPPPAAGTAPGLASTMMPPQPPVPAGGEPGANATNTAAPFTSATIPPRPFPSPAAQPPQAQGMTSQMGRRRALRRMGPPMQPPSPAAGVVDR
jgi:hypothetical protein